MAVFTRITHDELNTWLHHRNCGELLSFEGISSGIENTNYFVNTSQGRFVLTIFEKLTSVELPFYLELMQHLSQKGLPVPGPKPSNTGELFSDLQGKPATLVNCLQGSSVEHPTPSQCRAIGSFLGQAHQAVLDFEGATPNPRGLAWIQETKRALKQYLPAPTFELLSHEVEHQTTVCASDLYQQLPKGAVHADLFRDNALMLGEQLGGVIDFYFAGVDTFLFDLAVTANDWCIDHQTGALLEPHLNAMIEGYQTHRPLNAAECALWQDTLRAAALRFWTSRLYDYHMPREAEVLNVKAPGHFEQILKARQQGIPFCLS
jgi:homoserine kinase type II